MKVKLGCDGCIRRKTMFCPPSIECMDLDNLPYYLDKTSALEEIERLNNILNELEKDLYKIRELTFTKYNSNEWNNCLSFNDDILPVINTLKELKGDGSNETNK